MDDLLRDPRGRGSVRNVEMNDFAPFMAHAEQHVEHASGHRRHHKEIHGRNGRRMCFWRKVRQLWDGGRRNLGRYFRMVAVEACSPSLASSSRMRDEPPVMMVYVLGTPAPPESAGIVVRTSVKRAGHSRGHTHGNPRHRP